MDFSLLATFISRVMEEKRAMLAEGRQRGTFACPKCGCEGAVAMVGKKNHARAACQTANCLTMLE
jgi:transcription elongation factor Elf1